MGGCNCWIGILNAFDQSDLYNLYLSDYGEKCENKAKTSYKMIRRRLIKGGNKPWEYLDRRKHLAELFNYCPFCGLKINWRDLRAGMKNKSSKSG